MNQITPIHTSLQAAAQFGASVLAARMGVAGYEPALTHLQEITAAEALFVVRQADNRRSDMLSAIGKERGADTETAVKAAFSRSAAPNAAIWSTPIEDARLWCLPLGRVGDHVFTIALLAHRAMAPDTLEELGMAARNAWHLGAQSLETAPSQDASGLGVDILGPNNPFGLTQAERRVCLQLRAGARPQKIASDSGKSIATIRTHLARIYSKTNCAGMVEVMHLLAQTHLNTPGEAHAI